MEGEIEESATSIVAESDTGSAPKRERKITEEATAEDTEKLAPFLA